MSDELRDFLRVLSAPGLLELRYRLSGGRGMRQRFFDGTHAFDAVGVISELGAYTDVYVGVLRRAHATGGRSAVRRAHVLWADCDTEEALIRLAAFYPRPTMVVASGSAHGRHAYWRLTEAIEPDAACALNRGIARALHADVRSTDPARILRVLSVVEGRGLRVSPARSLDDASANGER